MPGLQLLEIKKDRKEEINKLLQTLLFPYFKGEDTKVVERLRLSAQEHPSNSEAMTQTQVLRSKVQV